MATRSSNSIALDNSTDANFRAWAQFVEDTLVTTGGWVVTGDTGQTAISSLVHPTLTNEKRGYRVYRMNDALQSTSPVYMKINYGSGGGVNIPSLFVTIGTGSDGAGTITSIRYGETQIGGNTSSVTLTHHYGSADTNRVAIAMGVWTSNIGFFLFCLERSKDSNGRDTGDGLYLIASLNSAGGIISTNQYINLAGVSQPANEGGLGYVLSNKNPSTFNGNVGVGLVICFAGVALQPGFNVAMSRSSDFAAEATISLTVYGEAHTYQHLNASHLVVQNITLAADNNGRVFMRFD